MKVAKPSSKGLGGRFRFRKRLRQELVDWSGRQQLLLERQEELSDLLEKVDVGGCRVPRSPRSRSRRLPSGTDNQCQDQSSSRSHSSVENFMFHLNCDVHVGVALYRLIQLFGLPSVKDSTNEVGATSSFVYHLKYKDHIFSLFDVLGDNLVGRFERGPSASLTQRSEPGNSLSKEFKSLIEDIINNPMPARCGNAEV